MVFSLEIYLSILIFLVKLIMVKKRTKGVIVSDLTKKVLAGALKELLQEKPLSKITISDITNRAGVNRHTFYYHFRDINDLVLWIFSAEIAKRGINTTPLQDWQNALISLLDFAVKEKSFVLAVYHSPANECIIRQLYHYSYEYVERIIDDIAPGCRLSGEDREFLIDFINYGFIGILIKWVREGMKYDPEELIKHLATVSDEEFRVIINRMEIQSKN